MGHRIRQACAQKDYLKGVVEVDETYIGGKESNKHANKKTGHSTAFKQPVIGFKSRDGSVVAKAIPFVDKTSLTRMVKLYVLPGSIVYTDSHPGYKALPRYGYRHETVNHPKGEYVQGEVHTNSIEGFWALVKRVIRGTYTHVSPQYLQKYLDELTMRESSGNLLESVIDNSNTR